MSDIYAENHQNDPDNKPAADAAKLLPCPECNGRGYFADDMMGSSFTPCSACNTHEQCDDVISVRRRK